MQTILTKTHLSKTASQKPAGKREITLRKTDQSSLASYARRAAPRAHKRPTFVFWE